MEEPCILTRSPCGSKKSDRNFAVLQVCFHTLAFTFASQQTILLKRTKKIYIYIYTQIATVKCRNILQKPNYTRACRRRLKTYPQEILNQKCLPRAALHYGEIRVVKFGHHSIGFLGIVCEIAFFPLAVEWLWENCFLAGFGFSIWRFFTWEIFTGRIWANELRRGKAIMFPHKKNSYLLWGNLVIAFIGRTLWRKPPRPTACGIQNLPCFLGQNLECFSNSLTYPPSVIMSEKRSIMKPLPLFCSASSICEKTWRVSRNPKELIEPQEKCKKSVKTW